MLPHAPLNVSQACPFHGFQYFQNEIQTLPPEPCRRPYMSDPCCLAQLIIYYLLLTHSARAIKLFLQLLQCSKLIPNLRFLHLPFLLPAFQVAASFQCLGFHSDVAS